MKKTLISIAAVVALGASVSACGGTAPKPAPKPSSASPTPTPSPTVTATRPTTTPPTTPPPTSTVEPAPTEAQLKPTAEEPEDVSYANCREVRDAGAAPIRRGEPGYSSKLDRDGDGVACDN